MINKNLIVPIVLLIGLVAISGCTSNTGNSTPSMKNYTGNGYSFNYPSNWTVNNDTDVLLIYSNADSNTQTTLQVMLQSGGLNNENIIPTTGNFTKVSNSTATVGNVTANEVIYKSDLLRFSTVYFTKNGKTYIFNFQAPDNEFDKEKINFDTILNSFVIQ